jgi:hypothetical protein
VVEIYMGDSRDIFLSHATADKGFVRAFAEKLGKQELAGRRLTYWLDEAEIKGSVPGSINEGLEKSTFFAAIMTPSYFNSRSGWTDAEWHAALNVDPDNRSKRFIPILASDCPDAYAASVLAVRTRRTKVSTSPGSTPSASITASITGSDRISSSVGSS